MTLGSLPREIVELLREFCLYMSTILARFVDFPRDEDLLRGVVEEKGNRLCLFDENDREDGR